MPIESLHFEFYEKSYGQFTKTTQDNLELCTVLFEVNFRRCVVVVVFCSVNKSVVGILKPLIMGF